MTDHDPKTITISEQAAAQVSRWLEDGRGVAEWTSIDLSDLGFRLLSPARANDGTPTLKPHWKVASDPATVVESPDAVLVCYDVEVKRFHIGVRRGAQGFTLKVTDASTRRIRREVEKAGKGAHYTFDYDTQQAVIWRPSEIVTLTEWRKRIIPKDEALGRMLEEQ